MIPASKDGREGSGEESNGQHRGTREFKEGEEITGQEHKKRWGKRWEKESQTSRTWQPTPEQAWKKGKPAPGVGQPLATEITAALYHYRRKKHPRRLKEIADGLVGAYGACLREKDVTHLISAYTECGQRESAAFILSRVWAWYGVRPQAHHYCAVLAACCKAGTPDCMARAQTLYRAFLATGQGDNVHMLVALLGGYCRVGDMDMAVRLQWKLREVGHRLDSGLCTSLISGFFKARMPSLGRAAFAELRSHGLPVSEKNYFAMVDGLSRVGEVEEAASIAEEALTLGFPLDEPAVNSLLAAIYRHDREEMAERWLNYALNNGLRVNEVTVAAMATHFSLHSNASSMEGATHRIAQMATSGQLKSPSTYVRFLCSAGHAEEALGLVMTMESKGMRPDDTAFLHLLRSFGHFGAWPSAEATMDLVERLEVTPTLSMYTYLLKSYGRNTRSHLQAAATESVLAVFDRMEAHLVTPDAHAYAMAIRALRDIRAIEKLFQAALCRGVQPNEFLFGQCISAFLRAGDKGPATMLTRQMLDSGIRPRPSRLWAKVQKHTGIALLSPEEISAVVSAHGVGPRTFRRPPSSHANDRRDAFNHNSNSRDEAADYYT